MIKLPFLVALGELDFFCNLYIVIK